MNKAFELEHLRNLLMNPELPSGLYLLDTDLTDEEIEEYIIELGCCSYMKESLFPPSRGGSAFELFVVGLSHQCAGNIEISNLRNLLFTSDGAGKDNIIYSLLIQMMKHLCMNGRIIIHVYGELDLTTLTHEDLYKLKESLTHHKDVIIVASKNKGIVKKGCDPLIKTLVFKEQKYKLMENRLDRVHISYKNDYAHEDALKAVIAGLEKNNIAYSIDRYDILYGDCIDKYEEEIGASDRIIMFVIPSYFKSIECMYEMTQMFLNGKVRERIIRLVDMEGIQRNGDGLSEIKDYWQGEKARKAQRMVDEPGGSRFISMEIRKIDEIIRTLDDLWFFICRDSTGDYKKLIENDAELLIEELKKTLYKVEAKIDEKFVPSGDTQPSVIRKTTLNGDKSLYVENNTGIIIIGADMHKRRNFSTEIKEAFSKPYIKVYFLDDSVASYAKEVIERLNVVKTVNITPSSSKDHPGNTLTVYPKSMVDVEDCEKEMIEALNGFFSRGVIADRKPVRNDAYFNLIADKIIKDLDKARVSIHVCIAWFTNQNIADKLVEKYKQGIDVKVIFYDDHTNSKFGVNIDGIPFKAVRGSRGGLMHNKYCIIDNQIVITGSYNWSENAEKKNDENTAVMYDYDRASDYSVEFRKMFATE